MNVIWLLEEKIKKINYYNTLLNNNNVNLKKTKEQNEFIKSKHKLNEKKKNEIDEFKKEFNNLKNIQKKKFINKLWEDGLHMIY